MKRYSAGDRHDVADVIGAVAIVVLVVIVGVALWRGRTECNKRGGHYVRGLVWMECIR